MSRFECLNLKCLVEPIFNKYCEVLGKFASEIDKVQKVNLLPILITTTYTYYHYLYLLPLPILITTTYTYYHYLYLLPLPILITTTYTYYHYLYLLPLPILITTTYTYYHYLYLLPLPTCTCTMTSSNWPINFRLINRLSTLTSTYQPDFRILCSHSTSWLHTSGLVCNLY